jgi:hypothetical protein
MGVGCEGAVVRRTVLASFPLRIMVLVVQTDAACMVAPDVALDLGMT